MNLLGLSSQLVDHVMAMDTGYEEEEESSQGQVLEITSSNKRKSFSDSSKVGSCCFRSPVPSEQNW